MLSGQTLEAFLISIAHSDPLVVGLNCALGPDEMNPFVEELARVTPTFVERVSECRTAGSAVGDGISGNTGNVRAESAAMGAQRLAEHGRRLLRNDAGTYSGVCRNGFRASAAVGAANNAGKSDRFHARGIRDPQSASRNYPRLSGLEPLNITPEFGFVVIGERTNVTGSPKFSRAILAGDFDGAVAIARQQSGTEPISSTSISTKECSIPKRP